MNFMGSTIVNGIKNTFQPNSYGLTDVVPLHIAQYLKKLDVSIESEYHLPEIPELINGTVLNGGKKFRPLLCLMMGDLFYITPQEMTQYARVSELTHSATLAHDDVIDNSTLRRNKSTINHVSSNTRAILSGDFLLAKAMVELSDCGNVNIIKDLANTLLDLVDGEWIQLGVKGNFVESKNQVDSIAEKKTASMFRWCCMVAPRILDADIQLVRSCRELGHCIGMIFQIVDDILDFDPKSKKPFALDIANGQINYVTVAMVDKYPELLEKIAAIYGQKNNKEWPWTEDQLNYAKNVTIEKAKLWVSKGQKSLSEIEKICKANGVAYKIEVINSFKKMLGLLVFRHF